MKYSVVLLIFISLLSFALCSKEDYLIKNLPGLENSINFKQYSGYITVDAAHGRKLFFWHTQSERNPEQDPLVLWLNGGPGCSSVGGMMTEMGPFRPFANGTLQMNPYAWNKVANMIYLESPAGVGFSFSNDPSDYIVGDKRTANDSYTFLQGFLDIFPEYRNRPFWVTGESYGGHYVPELVDRIVEGNKVAPASKQINIKGFMAGNAWTVPEIENKNGAVFYWWSHGLISDASYHGLNANCNYSDIGPLTVSSEFAEVDPVACQNFVSKAMNEMGGINIYDIYVNVCKQSDLVRRLGESGSMLHKALADKMDEYEQTHPVGQPINPPYRPCNGIALSDYLNTASVKAAIHANASIEWTDCSRVVQYNRADVLSSVLPLYQKFVRMPNLNVHVYSGDVDAIVPYTGTREWIAALKLPVTKPWRSWEVEGQVGGFTIDYQGLKFSTVRGAGHMVPEFQPARALKMFSTWVSGGDL